MLNDKERKEILTLSEGEHYDYDTSQTWLDLFRSQVSLRPEQPAVCDETSSMTYSELDRQSDRLAAWLIEKEGVQPDQFVAVRMGRVKEFLVAVLGIHKAGAAYLPIDLDYPAGRISYMMEDSGSTLTITEYYLQKVLHAPGPAGTVFPGCTPESFAYMIYTSGSTGKPKGVVIQQKAVLNFIHFIRHRWSLNKDSRIACHSNFAFDAAVEDLYPALTVGGRVFIVPEEARRDIYQMRAFIQTHSINGGSYSTQFGQLLACEKPLDVDYICVGGEAMTRVPLTSGHVYNVYGPTEFTVDATYFELEKDREYRNIPIGRPLYNCSAFVVNENMELVPRGEIGELCLGGAQMAWGYWKRPELTAEKFTFLRISDTQTCKVYRTGDLVRYNEEGQLEFCGRIDFQVKLRGFRVELEEVESCAQKFDGIRQCSAQVRKNTLCLYYTAAKEVDETALSRFMSGELADYMVPGFFLRLDSMPHNINGKIDRNALPDPVLTGSGDYIPPENETEQALSDAMQRALGSDTPVSRTADFFEIGGDSIKAIFLVCDLRDRNYYLSVGDIMKYRTVCALAPLCRRDAQQLTVSQEPVTGPVEDTAIFAFFKDLDYPEPDYYNQSTLLEWNGRASLQALVKASNAIVYTHDMLRAVIKDGHLFVRGAEAVIPVEEYTLPEDSTRQIRDLCEEIQSHLDTRRALVREALIHAGNRDLFFLTAHHTIVDGVSWRIWLADLEQAYGQALEGADPVTLPAKTHSYQEYAQAMKEYRDSYELSLEIPYWKKVDARMRSMETSANKDYSRHFQLLQTSMDEAATDAFLHARLSPWSLEVNDLLLAAVGRGFRDCFGKDSVSVSLEGHGREELGRTLYTDRTIGWFTSIYPVVLEDLNGDPAHDLKSVKETLHRIPNKGIGYNILAFVEGNSPAEFQNDLAPMLIFNYLGNVSGDQNKGLYFRPDSADGFSAGLDYQSEKNCDGSDLIINCLVDDGRFTLWLGYNADRFSAETAQQFADTVLCQIRELQAFLDTTEKKPVTASDLGETEWEEELFEKVTSQFDEKGETIRRLYPLTPMQEGMLLEHVLHPESFAYRLVDIYEYHRELTQERLIHAIDQLVRKHEVFRTSIIHKDVPSFRQAIVDRRIPLTIVDLKDCADPLAEAKCIRRSILKDGYDLQDKPLLQIVWARISEKNGYLIMATHHIIVDGWCVDIYMEDFNRYLAGESDFPLKPGEEPAVVVTGNCVPDSPGGSLIPAGDSVASAGSSVASTGCSAASAGGSAASAGGGTASAGDSAASAGGGTASAGGSAASADSSVASAGGSAASADSSVASVGGSVASAGGGNMALPTDGLYEQAVRELVRKDRSAAADYFAHLLDGYENKAALPSWGTVPEQEQYPDDQLIRTIAPGPVQNLLTLCQSAGATLSDGFCLAIAMMLRTVTRLDDVVFTTVVSGRDGLKTDVTQLTGLFINTVPVRVSFQKDSTARNMLESLRSQAVATKPWEYCPLADIQKRLGGDARLGDVVVSFENYSGAFEADRILCPVLFREEHEAEDVSFDAIVNADGSVGITVSFEPARYRASEIERILDLIDNYITQIVQHPDRPLIRLPHLKEESVPSILSLSAGEEYACDLSLTWVDLFREQARKNPEQIAVVDENSSFTYGELDQQSDYIAAALLAEGIKVNEFAAVRMDRVKEFVAAVLGIHKAGAAYMPIDLDYPAERVRFMLEDSRARLMITGSPASEAGTRSTGIGADMVPSGGVSAAGAKSHAASSAGSQPDAAVPAGSQPHAASSAGSQPGAAVPAGSQPHAEALADSQPDAAVPAGAQPHAEASAGSQPGTAGPDGAQPHAEASAGSQPGTAGPGAAQPDAAPVFREITYHALLRRGEWLIRQAADHIQPHEAADDMKSVPAASVNRPLCRPDHIAYMIYTSGSTGLPKGVMIPHRAMTNFVAFIRHRWGLNRDSRIACHSNFAFDAAVEDLYPVLTAGGTLFLVPEEARRDLTAMRTFLARHHITGGCYATQFGQLLGKDTVLDLDYICLGGEAMVSVPDTRGAVYNTYGPTEFTVDATYYELEKGREYRNIPIGRPLYNCSGYVLDSKGNLLPRGVAGELCMSGPQIALGYWNRPELTAEKFTTLRLPGRDPIPIYRTGDLVRYNEEDQLEYIGRIDTMVKLRGFRVELGEVEKVALSFPGISRAAAEIRKIGSAAQLILYYITQEPKVQKTESADRGDSRYAHSSGPEALKEYRGVGPDVLKEHRGIDPDALKEFCAEKLAEYMVPGIFLHLDEMPMTASGKIDRKNLPMPDISMIRTEYAPPENETEKKLCRAYAQVLGLAEDQVGRNDDFFQIGGDSIRAMMITAAAGLPGLQAADVYRCKTPAKLAQTLSESTKETVTMETELQARAMVLPATGGQVGMVDYQFVNIHSTMYNMPFLYRLNKGLDTSRLLSAVNTVIHSHPSLATELFFNEDGDLVQHYAPEKISDVVLEEVSPENLDAFLAGLIRPFQMFRKLLYRIRVFTCCGELYLFLDMHHTISDGVSIGILMDDIAGCYSGKAPSDDYYYSFLLSESRAAGSEKYQKAENYFRTLLGDTSWCTVPTPDYVSWDADVGEEIMHPGISMKDMELAEEKYEASGNVLCLAAGILALQEYCGRPDIQIKWINDNRTRSWLAGTVGLIFRIPPVAVHMEALQSVHDLLEEIKEQVINGFIYSDCDFAEIFENTLEDSMEINYLAAIEDGEDNSPLQILGTEEIALTSENPAAGERVGLYIEQEDGQLTVTAEYQKNAYANGSMKRFLDMFRKYLRFLVLDERIG